MACDESVPELIPLVPEDRRYLRLNAGSQMVAPFRAIAGDAKYPGYTWQAAPNTGMRLDSDGYAWWVQDGEDAYRMDLGGGTVDGAGTTAHVAYWSDADTLAGEAQLSLLRGGTGADLSATGGASQVLKQLSAGGAVTVGTLVASDVGAQPLDAGLTSLAALPTVADRIAYSTAADTWAETALTSFGRSLIDDADAATGRNTLGASTGIWPLALGGTAADLSATGGTGQFLRQSSAGAAITVSAIGHADLGSGGGSGTKYLRDDMTWQTVSAGVTDHGALTGLGDDDHTQYALLLGRSGGGQTLYGGTGTTDYLYVRGTSYDTSYGYANFSRAVGTQIGYQSSGVNQGHTLYDGNINDRIIGSATTYKVQHYLGGAYSDAIRTNSFTATYGTVFIQMPNTTSEKYYGWISLTGDVGSEIGYRTDSLLFDGTNFKLFFAGTEKYRYTTSGAMFGAAANAARVLEVRSTSAQQRWSYDASNYAEITVDIAGNLAITHTGSTANRLKIGNNCSTGAVTGPIAIGWNARANKTASIAMGYNTVCNGDFGVSIGYNIASATGSHCIGIGRQTTTSGNGGIALGVFAASASECISIGSSAAASVSPSIALGRDSVANAANTFVAGSSGYMMSNVYFGKGMVNASPTAWTLNGTGGSGTNIAGGALQIAGGKGTGNAAGGSVKIQASTAGASGTTLQTLATVAEFGPATIGFYGVTPVARPAAYTQTYSTADRTLAAYTADNESAAYTGIDNAQVGTVYAQLTDLNALRTAYENLRAFVEDLAQHHNSVVDDLQAVGLLQ